MIFLNQSKKTVQVFSKLMRYLKISDIEGADYHRLKIRYMRELTAHLGLQIRTKNASVSQNKTPTIFVSNHISYLDIPVIMCQVPQASFISKAEVADWPLIGPAAQKIGTVFVKRGCKKSRQAVRDSIAQAVLKEGKSIAVFPSGTTKIVKSESWRRGVFEIAQEHQIPIVPIRLMYTPLRKAAYIDRDNLVLHLFAMMKGEPMSVELEFGSPRCISDASRDAIIIQQWCEESMLSEAPADSAVIPILQS